MKLRVRLNQGNEQKKIEIVADGTATAGDVALAVASAGSEVPLTPETHPLTLRVSEDYRSPRVLEPSTPLSESGIPSGAQIELVSPQQVEESHEVGAILRIVAGPDTGVEVPLRVGRSSVGRDSTNHVRLSDRRASKRHATILVGSRIEVIDENSANGVLLAGQKVIRAAVDPGDTVVMGETQMMIERLAIDTELVTESDVRHLRPPVVLQRPAEREIELPELPNVEQRSRFPWLALMAPLVMGATMYVFTRSAASLLFVAMSPVLMLGGWVGNVIDTRRKRRLERENYLALIEQISREIEQAQQDEVQRRNTIYPTVTACVESAVYRDAHLWSRRPEHPEFLQVRMGVGRVPPLVTLKPASPRGEPDLLDKQHEILDRFEFLEAAPIEANLRSVGGVGVAGSTGVAAAFARGLVLQSAVLHSPAELVVACLTSNTTKPEWDWLEWVPHSGSTHSPIPGALLASDDARGRVLVDAVEELIEARSEGKEPDRRGPLTHKQTEESATEPIVPSVLLVVHDAAVGSERLARIAERGPDVGVHVLWVAPDRQKLPAACRTFIDLNNTQGASVGMVRSESVYEQVSTESVDINTAEVTARSLAPVVDATAPTQDDTDLPRSVSVVGLLGPTESTESDQILNRWRQNGSLVDRSGPIVPREHPGDLRALVGHTGMDPFSIDLRAQGPHALVGGTTGSGKSEFLQAWVLGMAHANSPDRVTFLFVDYKGGAAFAKCVDLPHAVGLVTDLSPYLVRRALRSLRAEIHRREHLFNDKGVKDIIDFEKTGDPDCPPSLIIIVDEFAALAGEVPEFVDGVIDVAQRGRSLGLHLILATQRPAGVIKDSLRANTNLRIALRMNDEHDSSDVLGSKMAAEIDPSTPGRGVARVGPARLISFQSAFPGARTPEEPPAPPIDVLELDFGSNKDLRVPRPQTSGPVVDKDIERVVDAIAGAADRGSVVEPRKPWLEELSTAYDLNNLNQRSDEKIVLGVVDDPDLQSQHVMYFEPDESGNIAYFGAGGSGKTTALRSLAVAASITPRSGPTHIYGLDFGGGGLGLLEPLVNVGGIIMGDDEERVDRLSRMLTEKMDERVQRFIETRSDSLVVYRRQEGQAGEPRILVLIDGFGIFREEYDSGLGRQATFARFQRLMSEGRAAGIHFAITADRAGAMPTFMAGSFQKRIVLRMPDQDAYLSLNVPKDVLDPNSPPGRSMDTDEPNELQLAILGRDPSPTGQAREIELLAEATKEFQSSRPEPVRRMPEHVAATDVPAKVRGLPTLGIEDLSLQPMGYEPQGVFLLAGPPRSGLSSSMRWFAETMAHSFSGLPLILLSARTTPLSDLGLWTAKVMGADAVKDYLTEKVKPYVSTEAPPGRPAIALFVDQYAEFAGSPAESVLTDTLKSVRRNGHALFAGGETSSFTGFSPLISELKSSRAGLLLQPEQNDGDLLKVGLPRVKASEYPPGRGFWVQFGSVSKVQIPQLD